MFTIFIWIICILFFILFYSFIIYNLLIFPKYSRTAIRENVELIKLQREVKEKVASLQNLQSKYHNLEEVFH